MSVRSNDNRERSANRAARLLLSCARLLPALIAATACGSVEQPTRPAQPPRADLTLEIAPGELALPRERLERWVGDAQSMVRETFGRFPVAELAITVQPRPRSRGIRDGRTWPAGTGAAIEVGVGSRAGETALERDWVLVHEMIHLAVPELPPEQHWFEEGVATYLEPFARARGGKRSEEDVWREITRDYAQGEPQPGEGGIDDTPTWARTYYGGALFCLEADVEIARATHGAKSLRDGFEGTVARRRSILQHTDLASFAGELDRALGVAVVAPLYARWAHTAVTVDLDALWRELGVVREGRTLRFDDTAPLAAWRRSLVAVPAGREPR
ncbi:MAG: hypothetical protein IPJ19_04715 [Planctomycetes bacterium]|nr:hypothetical protein [Planctomycetota bacterium]